MATRTKNTPKASTKKTPVVEKVEEQKQARLDGYLQSVVAGITAAGGHMPRGLDAAPAQGTLAQLCKDENIPPGALAGVSRVGQERGLLAKPKMMSLAPEGTANEGDGQKRSSVWRLAEVAEREDA
jgi:hypothetical protein